MLSPVIASTKDAIIMLKSERGGLKVAEEFFKVSFNI